MTQARYLIGTHADSAEAHIIVREADGKRFAWCKPDAEGPRVTSLAVSPEQVTCPRCHDGSLMWWIERKRNS